MGVVRIDDKILRALKDIIKREENKYKYGSLSSMINSIIYDSIKKEVKK